MQKTSTVWVVFMLAALILSACTVMAPMQEGDAPVTDAGDMSELDESETDEDDMPGMDHGDAMGFDDPDLFDAQFIDSMIEHHQGAVDMAQQVLAQSERPELRALAEEIIAAQTREIEDMSAWRAAWYPDLDTAVSMGRDMGAMEISPDESAAFDQRFLEAMISHHVGAIEMAEMALQISEREEIRTLAEAVITGQRTEIDQMRGWLYEWYEVAE